MSTLIESLQGFANIIGFAEPKNYIINVRVQPNGDITVLSKPFTKESKRFGGKQMRYIPTLLNLESEVKLINYKGKQLAMVQAGAQNSKIADNLWQGFNDADYRLLVEALAAMPGITIAAAGDIKVDLAMYPQATSLGIDILTVCKSGSFYNLPLPTNAGYVDNSGTERFNVRAFVPAERCKSIVDVWESLKYEMLANGVNVEAVSKYYGIPYGDTADGSLTAPAA
jgi:hypothetical protein